MKINTLQEYKQARFNAAYRGLRWQKFQKVVDAFGFSTQYHSPVSGHCCALGWSVTTANSGWFGLAAPLREFYETASESDLDAATYFDGSLSECHDSATSRTNMKQRLHQLARYHKLTIPKLDPKRGW